MSLSWLKTLTILRGEAQRNNSQTTNHAADAHPRNYQKYRRPSNFHVTYTQIRSLWVLEVAFLSHFGDIFAEGKRKALEQDKLYISLK